jgi:hypothetical protein
MATRSERFPGIADQGLELRVIGHPGRRGILIVTGRGGNDHQFSPEVLQALGNW